MADTGIRIPKHIAVIMDGNRRWAREHKLPELMGHRRVADEILEPLIEHAAKRGVRVMTFWAWSTENWGRTEGEVSGIMDIFRHVIRKRWQRLAEKGVRIRVIGDTSRFPEDIRRSLADVVEETANNTVITAVFALNYGGRDEIVRAVRKVVVYAGEHPGVTIDKGLIEGHLDTAGLPDPELIIRTGGEQRLSGFLLWQSEYAEFWFPAWYMPDFTPDRLDEGIAEYNERKRRFGK